MGASERMGADRQCRPARLMPLRLGTGGRPGHGRAPSKRSSGKAMRAERAQVERALSLWLGRESQSEAKPLTPVFRPLARLRMYRALAGLSLALGWSVRSPL